MKIEEMTGNDWIYKKLNRFCAGIEGNISMFKRTFGLDRYIWRGLEYYNLKNAVPAHLPFDTLTMRAADDNNQSLGNHKTVAKWLVIRANGLLAKRVSAAKSVRVEVWMVFIVSAAFFSMKAAVHLSGRKLCRKNRAQNAGMFCARDYRQIGGVTVQILLRKPREGDRFQKVAVHTQLVGGLHATVGQQAG